jgi:hypothetical protein
MRRLVKVTTILFWASASIMLVFVALSWVASGLRDEWAFNLSSGAAAGLAMVTSGLLFWLELRDTRRENRTLRRENRAVRVEDLGEWSPKGWLYATAFGLSFFLSWYLLPALFFA